MAMEQDINDAISKNMPAAVGEVLRQRLEQADKDSKKLYYAENEIVQLRVQLAQHATLKTREEAVTKRESSAALREEAVKDRERETDHIIQTAEIRRDCYMERVKDLKEVVQTVFRSPVFSRCTTTREDIPTFTPTNQMGNSAGYHGKTELNKISTETVDPNAGP